MPIYAYKCESCGFAKDVLQKISDTPLQECPHCNAPTFKKQLTAAGFQLKGSGWYVTDFKGGSAPSTGVAPAAGDSSSTPAVAAVTAPAAPAAATSASTPPVSSTPKSTS